MLIYLKGSDSYQAKKTIADLRQKYLAKNPDGLELIEIDSSAIVGTGGSQMNLADLQAVPLFATSRLVIIKEASKLLKAAQDELAHYLLHMPTTTVVVLWDGGSFSSPELEKVGQEASKVIPVMPLEGLALKNRAKKMAQSLDLSITEGALAELINNSGSDLWALEQELIIRQLGGEANISTSKEKGPDFVYYRLCRSQDWPRMQRQLAQDIENGRPIELLIGELAGAIRKELPVDNPMRLKLTDRLMDFDLALKTGLLDDKAVTALLICALPKNSQMQVEWERVWQDQTS